MNLLNVFCLVLILFAGPPVVAAAAAPPGAIHVELRVAATDIAGAHHTLWLRTGPDRDPLEVPLNVRTFSNPIEYKGAPNVEFYATEVLARAAEPSEKPLLATTLPAGKTLLVFLPGDGAYRALSIAGSDFPFGAFRFANLTRTAVRAEVANQAANLAPGASKTFAFAKNEPSLAVKLYARVEGNGARLLRQTNWSINSDQRELILFFVNPENGLVQTRHFVDSRQIPPKAATASAGS